MRGTQGRAWKPASVPPSQARAGQPGRGDSPIPGHRTPPWGRGQAKARLGCGPVARTGRTGRAGLWELETGPAAASLGQRLMVLGF